MILPKTQQTRDLFVRLFVRAMNADRSFFPASLFTEEDKSCDDLAIAQALSLLREYCTVWHNGVDVGKWSVRPTVIVKYRNKYYEKFGIVWSK